MMLVSSQGDGDYEEGRLHDFILHLSSPSDLVLGAWSFQLRVNYDASSDIQYVNMMHPQLD